MKKILISCATHDASRYAQALVQSGIEAVLSDHPEDAAEYDGLLLPGGGDIHPAFYHKKNYACQNICITEDFIQIMMFHRFLEEKKPILGICKGMQLINVALGGNLTQDIPTKKMHAYVGEDQYHIIKAMTDSHLYSLYGKECITNSAHHQAVSHLGERLHITQYSLDGVAEGIEHDFLPIIGVQWHPERLMPPDHPGVSHPSDPSSLNYADGSKLFSYLFSFT